MRVSSQGVDHFSSNKTAVYLFVMTVLFDQTWYLLLVAASLISRTYADVWMIQNGTAIERSASSSRHSVLSETFSIVFLTFKHYDLNTEILGEFVCNSLQQEIYLWQ